MSDFGLPSSPKGEIVGIMTQVWLDGISVVLDGNSLKIADHKVRLSK